MLDLLASAAAFTAVVALALTGLSALTLVPFVLALRLAERRGFDSVRWGALALAGSVVGAGVVALALRSTPVLAVVGLILAYAVPLLLTRLRPGSPVGGRAGRHQ